MNAPVVYAHHESRSFNAAMKDVAVRALEAAGWTVRVSDLYAEGFKANAGPEDYTRRSGSERFGYLHEMKHAAATRAYVPDILREQDRVAAADLLLFQFPLWWYAAPAIVKGWADRVLTDGFAYTDERLFANGLLKGKRGMLCVTTGATPEELAADSDVTGTMDEILRPFSGGVLQYVGMTVEPPFIAYAPGSASPAARSDMLKAFARHVEAAATRAR
jgi:putative NADPH-quinone reductase